MDGFIREIGVAFLVATILGIITQKIKQPIILGYFIAGVILGPEIGPAIVTDPSNIETISEIGLILLLFIIGLEMNIPKILKAGKQMLIVGMGQFVLCVTYGLILFGVIGYSLKGQNLDGLYLALLCAISSTAIVVKLLYDKMELDTLPGRITLGVLILQDIWVVIILAFQPNFHTPELRIIILAIIKCIALVSVSFIVSKYILSRIFQDIAKSPELVVIASVGWCAAVAGVSGILGLSKEMGALIAGVVISAFPYSVFVCAKVLPLRDFFLTLFFVSLGMKISFPTVSLLTTSLLVGLFILITRFLSVYPILLLTGSGRRTAFISSLNLSQLSEFSLVVAALGISYNHITEETMEIFIYTMSFTAIISSYLIQFNHSIFAKFDSLLKRIGIMGKKDIDDELKKEEKKFPVIILGFHRGAKVLVEEISQDQENVEMLKKILVVDFNTEVLNEVRSQGIEGMYGDFSHIDTLKRAGVEDAKIILLTIPDMLLKGTNNANLVKICRTLNPTAFIVATADFNTHAQELKKLGANEVILPYSLAGKYLVPIVKAGLES